MNRAALLLAAATLFGCGGGAGADAGTTPAPDAPATGGPDAGPDGPPHIRQVFVSEGVDDRGTKTNFGMAFGDHPGIALSWDDRDVTRARPRDAEVRVVLDRVLSPRLFQEVRCNDGGWDHVPQDAADDDIAACGAPHDQPCSAVCSPDGYVDTDEDRDPDQRRFSATSLRVVCDGVDAPIDTDRFQGSRYEQTGSQRLDPVVGGSGRAPLLGPALDLRLPALRTSATCTIELDERVADAAGRRLCAPTGDPPTCAPGDSGAIAFRVDPLRVLGSDPSEGKEVRFQSDVLFQLNADLDPASLAGVAMTGPGGPMVIAATLDVDDDAIVIIEPETAPLPPGSYTVTLPAGASGVADVLGGALAAPHLLTFTVTP